MVNLTIINSNSLTIIPVFIQQIFILSVPVLSGTVLIIESTFFSGIFFSINHVFTSRSLQA